MFFREFREIGVERIAGPRALADESRARQVKARTSKARRPLTSSCDRLPHPSVLHGATLVMVTTRGWLPCCGEPALDAASCASVRVPRADIAQIEVVVPSRATDGRWFRSLVLHQAACIAVEHLVPQLHSSATGMLV
jgi:hypothetical protein